MFLYLFTIAKPTYSHYSGNAAIENSCIAAHTTQEVISCVAYGVKGSRDEEYLATDGRMMLACKLIATFASLHLERYT
jgi:hypothetical protein